MSKDGPRVVMCVGLVHAHIRQASREHLRFLQRSDCRCGADESWRISPSHDRLGEWTSSPNSKSFIEYKSFVRNWHTHIANKAARIQRERSVQKAWQGCLQAIAVVRVTLPFQVCYSNKQYPLGKPLAL
eukprot:5579498-Amphidinium_carterae.1